MQTNQIKGQKESQTFVREHRTIGGLRETLRGEYQRGLGQIKKRISQIKKGLEKEGNRGEKP